MKVKFIFAALISLFSIIATHGQTASDFEKKYDSQTYYKIRPKILMSAKFSAGGEVCRVTFQPNNFLNKTNTVILGEKGLDILQLKESFEDVVPKEWRSGQIKPPSPLSGFNISSSKFSGNTFSGNWKTKNIEINMSGSLISRANLDFCELFGTKKENFKKQEIFFCTLSGTLEVLTINWVKRDCINN